MPASSAPNDVQVLDVVLGGRTGPLASPEPSTQFELFAAEQVLKPFDLTDDEILDGHVAGGDDGGIDGLYVLLEGNAVLSDSDLLEADFDPSTVKRGSTLEIHVIQAKQTPSFDEVTV